MNPRATPSTSWSTASFGAGAETTPGELNALGSHLTSCRDLGGRLFELQCAADSVHQFVAARFVTTLVVAALLIGGCALVA